MSEHIIWVSESDLCDYCDSLLDEWGNCPQGCDLVELDREIEELEDEGDFDNWYDDLEFDEQGRYIGG